MKKVKLILKKSKTKLYDSAIERLDKVLRKNNSKLKITNKVKLSDIKIEDAYLDWEFPTRLKQDKVL